MNAQIWSLADADHFVRRLGTRSKVMHIPVVSSLEHSPSRHRQGSWLLTRWSELLCCLLSHGNHGSPSANHNSDVAKRHTQTVTVTEVEEPLTVG